MTNEERSRRATTAHMGTTAEGLSTVHDLAELPRTPGPMHTQTFGPLVGPAAGRAQAINRTSGMLRSKSVTPLPSKTTLHRPLELENSRSEWV